MECEVDSNKLANLIEKESYKFKLANHCSFYITSPHVKIDIKHLDMPGFSQFYSINMKIGNCSYRLNELYFCKNYLNVFVKLIKKLGNCEITQKLQENICMRDEKWIKMNGM